MIASVVHHRIALGSAQFGLDYGINNSKGKVSIKEIKKIISLAKNEEIKTIDTAISYGDAEKRLGLTDLKDFKVISKIPNLENTSENIDEYLQKVVNISLQNLNIKSFYALLLHNPLDLLKSNGKILYKALVNLKETGKTKKIGISVYSPDELKLLLAIFQFDIIQAPFNIIDQRLNQSGWMHKLKDLNIEIHTRSTFLQGLLLMQRKLIPNKYKKWDVIWDRWHSWLDLHDQNNIETCLSFCLSYKEIDQVIIGVDSYSQWKQILTKKDCKSNHELPDINSKDEMLINPSNWKKL